MSALAIFYLCATFAPFLLNWATRQKSDAMGFSALLILVWLCERFLRIWYAPPEALRPYAIMDLACGLVALRLWWTSREWWKMALVWAFTFQLCAHAAYWLSWVENPTDKHALRVYMVTLNATYLLELLLVGSGGIRSAMVGLVSAVPRGARFLRHLGSGP